MQEPVHVLGVGGDRLDVIEDRPALSQDCPRPLRGGLKALLTLLVVSDAMGRLLGLENVETVGGHFTAAARRFRRESIATGGNELQSAGEELDRIEGELTVQNAKLGTIKARISEVDEQIRLDEREIDSIKGLGDLDLLQARIHGLESDLDNLRSQETTIRQQVKDYLRSEHVSKQFLGVTSHRVV